MFNHFARYEQPFANWRRDGCPGVKAETYRYIDFLSDPADDQAPREGTLWPHQWEAFLRVVYSHEILGKTEIGTKGLLLNTVTGGGKTAAIAALIAWLRVAHAVKKFVLLCPKLHESCRHEHAIWEMRGQGLAAEPGTNCTDTRAWKRSGGVW